MGSFRSQTSLISATFVASGLGWAAVLALLAATTGRVSERPGFGAWLHVAFAAWSVPVAFAAACALVLALGRVLEARFAAPVRDRPRAYATRVALLSVPLLGVPGYALAWALTASTTAWKPGVSEWQFALAALLAAPVARLLLSLGARAVRLLAGKRHARAAALLAAAVAYASWAFATASLRERYGASQLLGFGAVTAALVLVFFAWFEHAEPRFARAGTVLLLGLTLLGAGALLIPPSRAALELYHAERPTRWFARALVALLPDADADGSPRNLGLLQGGDCDDTNAERSPLAFDVPQNGIDENCFAGDAKSSLPEPSLFTRAALPPKPEPVPKNVLVLALDSVRFDSRHAGGVDPELMPELARLAASGLAFADFRTCAPRTRESVADLLGARPGTNERSGVQVLAERGVHTAFIASDWLARHAPLAGFGERRQPKARYGAFADGDVLRELDAFLSGAPREPFFLFSHLLGGHEPYELGGACAPDTKQPLARYRCALGELDRKLGALLSSLEKGGLAERTVVVVTADHGEEFGEHGGRYHATTLYDEILRVPLVMRVPGGAPSLVSLPLNCLDFLPTVLAAADHPPGLATRGHVRLHAEGQRAWAQFARTRAANEARLFEPKQAAVVHAGFKLLFDRSTNVGVYFDLTRDPAEAQPLSRAPAAVEARLLELMDAWLSDQAEHRDAGARLSSLPSSG